MIYFMAQNGVEIVWGQALFFVVITLGGIIIALAFYNKINITVKDPIYPSIMPLRAENNERFRHH